VHFDAFYATPNALHGTSTCGSQTAPRLGFLGCDSPLALLQSTFRDVSSIRPDVVVLGGDWERHQAITVNATWTYQTVARLLQSTNLSALPSPAITPLGNNDFIPDYYFNISATAPPPLLSSIARDLASVGMLDADENTTFASKGYFARRYPTLSLTILVLNTLIWSLDLSPAIATGQDPLGQFAFAGDTVTAARARGDKVIILSHIPPTINFFGVVQAGNNPTAAATEIFLQPSYQARYAQFVASSNDVIVAQVFAHTHRFSYSAAADMGSVPLFVLGAVSPIYSNNPNYLVMDFDTANGKVVSITQRFLPIAQSGDAAVWTWGSSIPAAFDPSQQVMDSRFMASLSRGLAANATAQAAWLRMYSGTAPESCDSFCYKLASCYVVNANPGNVLSCLFSDNMTTPTPQSITPTAAHGGGNHGLLIGLVVATIVIAVIVLGVAFYLLQRNRRKVVDVALTTTEQ
jgi:sphingomyelin phosphodiesterase acid-like 3